MLRILRAMFGRNSQGSYPESLIRQAIERAVDGTDPCLRAVSGYRKKLRPAVVRAIDHVVRMVDALPPPVPVQLSGSELDRNLKGYFISVRELQQFLTRDKALADFMEGRSAGQARVIVLLAMEMQQRGVFGAGLSGEIVVRDMPMVTVSFEGHRFLDPGLDEAATRRSLKIRAFDHLLGLALKRLAFVKSERDDLERHRTLLQAKLNLFERQGWGFDPSNPAGQSSQEGIEEQLGQIETQLQELGGDSGEFEVYLQVVGDVMGNPDQFLVARNETIFLDSMGIRQSEASGTGRELPLVEIVNAEGRRLVVMLVDFEIEDLRRLIHLPAG